jgi:uncharacterized protein (DUF1501 family)
MPEEYFYQEFPKHMYHEDGANVIVESQAEQDELGEGWFERIADMGVETCPAADPKTRVGSAIMPGFVATPEARSMVRGITGKPGAQVGATGGSTVRGQAHGPSAQPAPPAPRRGGD